MSAFEDIAPEREYAEGESEVAVGDADMEKLSRFEVDLAMFDQVQVQPWVTNSFQFRQTLQAAPRNHGSVDLMHSIDSGTFVAVKKMQNTWMTTDAKEFQKMRPGSSEQPWLDLALVMCLMAEAFVTFWHVFSHIWSYYSL